MPDSVLREPQAQPSQESKWGDARLVDSTSPVVDFHDFAFVFVSCVS